MVRQRSPASVASRVSCVWTKLGRLQDLSRLLTEGALFGPTARLDQSVEAPPSQSLRLWLFFCSPIFILDDDNLCIAKMPTSKAIVCLRQVDRSAILDDHPWTNRSRCVYRRVCTLAEAAMTPLMELALFTITPLIIGIIIGYSMRSYVSMIRRSRHSAR